uniref:Uncharacterized protein n=1 Tax=Timema monikensis TaxID=170555 RepID=A0A7R9HTE3_9NEOP|nr:unnamed protein product [Timema monikensis]
MLAFDLTPDSAGQDSQTILQTKGNVRFKLQFKTDLDTAITCLFYSEYEGTVSIDYNREDAGYSLRRFTDLFSTSDLCKNNRLAVTLFKRRFGHCPRCISSGSQTCCSIIGYKRSSVQTQTAMEKVMCSCNMVEDDLQPSSSLLTKTFYLNDNQNKHVAVGLFPNRNFYAHVMFSSNSKRLILTVPQWNFLVKEMPIWSNCVQTCVNFESNMEDFIICRNTPPKQSPLVLDNAQACELEEENYSFS